MPGAGMTSPGPPEPAVRRAPAHGSRSRDIGFALTAGAALAAFNNVISRHPWHHRRYVVLNLCATGAVLSAAAAGGLTAADLGLGRDRWRPGRLGARLAAGTAAGWLLVALLPAARPVLGDKRVTSLAGPALGYQAVIRIPVGTVLWEETAFRGVLQAALRRTMPERAAVMVTAAVFGVWHLRPTLEALRANGLAASPGQAASRVAAGSAATAAAGLLLSWLRSRSGSLAAPVLLHLVANCGGLLAAWAVARRHRAARGQAAGRAG